SGFFDVLVDVIDDALDERMAQPFFDCTHAPVVFNRVRFVFLLHRFGELDQALRGVGPAVEQYVLDECEQVPGDFLIDLQHAGIDNAHVEAGFDGVVKERAVHRLTHGVVAAKAEADVADAAADFRERKLRLDPPRRANEIDGIVGVLLHAGADGEDVRVENDVLRGEPDLLREQVVSALADLGPALKVVGLAAFVEGHHHDTRAVTADEGRLVKELFLAFLEADRVDDALAQGAFQSRFNDRPLRRVNHDRDPGDTVLASDQIEEPRHRRHAVDHAFVHADVDDLRAVLDLLTGNGQRRLEVVGFDELCKFRRTGNVGAFADVNEVDGGVGDSDPVPWDRYRLQPAQAKVRLHVRRLARSEAAHGVSDGFDVRRGGAAAAADDVQPAVLRPVLQLRRECFRCLRKTGGEQRIGQAGVGISADENRRDKGKFFDARAKFLRSQGAVHAD